MEGQNTSETVVDEEDDEKELYNCDDDFEPADLADQAYEQWRDEERLLEVMEQ